LDFDPAAGTDWKMRGIHVNFDNVASDLSSLTGKMDLDHGKPSIHEGITKRWRLHFTGTLSSGLKRKRYHNLKGFNNMKTEILF
jgi:hypothetical protein